MKRGWTTGRARARDRQRRIDDSGGDPASESTSPSLALWSRDVPPQGHIRHPKLGSEGTEKPSIRRVRGSCSEEPSWILQARSVSQPRNWLWASDDSNKLTAKKENKNGLSQGTGNGTTAGQGGGRVSASWGFGHRTRARSGDQHTLRRVHCPGSELQGFVNACADQGTRPRSTGRAPQPR